LFCQQNNLARENTLITICDADSLLPENFFSYLTYEYLKDHDRLYHFYWAPVLLYNNFWQLPFFVRIQATLSSILRIAFLSEEKKLIQISTYSTSLWLLEKVNYWIRILSPKTGIFTFKHFYFWNKVKTLPLYTLVNGDAVFSGGFFKTFKNRYEQEKRWAWGVSDISYALKKSFSTPNIHWWLKFKK
jgi:hypothetical protein